MMQKIMERFERELQGLTDRVMATVCDYPLTLVTFLIAGAVGGYLWAHWVWD